MADLDIRAERLLAVGLTAAELLDETGPAAVHATLAHLQHHELIGLVTLLLPCLDPDKARRLTGWAYVRPEHADEWYGDAPPMRVAWHGDPPALDVGVLVRERFGLPA